MVFFLCFILQNFFFGRGFRPPDAVPSSQRLLIRLRSGSLMKRERMFFFVFSLSLSLSEVPRIKNWSQATGLVRWSSTTRVTHQLERASPATTGHARVSVSPFSCFQTKKEFLHLDFDRTRFKTANTEMKGDHSIFGCLSNLFAVGVAEKGLHKRIRAFCDPTSNVNEPTKKNNSLPSFT